MSYIDALQDRDKEIIQVVSRVNGERIYTDYKPDYSFYVDDPRGKFTTIYGTPVSKITPKNNKEFQKEKAIHGNKKLWESDLNLINKCLFENYKDATPPELHIGLFDIEVNFDPERGYAPVTDPFNYITAITIYLDWLDKLVTFSLAPPGMSKGTANEIAANFTDCYIMDTEKDLLNAFLYVIEDVDVLSGWNSEGYDIPYTVNRIVKVLSKHDTRRLCLWNQYPKKRTFNRFGSENETYDTIGRIHMDYMQLYRKYTYEERHSYALNAIGEHEIGESKIAYEGSLDELYNKDFAKFLDYNRQDVLLLAKIDKKLKYIDLANVLAHEIAILLPATMGTVAVTDAAIVNRAHEQGLVVPNKKHDKESEGEFAGAVGAFVSKPKKGIHEWVGSVDINALYPSDIMAINMSPETIVGQITHTYTNKFIHDKMRNGLSFADAWENQFGCLEYQSIMKQELGTMLTIEWEHTKETTKMSAADVWQLIFNSNKQWTLSANGTIFTTENEGIIPGIFAEWRAARKDLQKKKAEATDPKQIEFYDKRQHVKKIQTNGAYGALLNPGCRFNDPRIGQSTTLSGRVITRHMSAFINQLITGEYDVFGSANIAGDTDSDYFTIWPLIKDQVEKGEMSWSIESAIEIYDSIAEQVNDSFAGFAEQAFHCPRERGELIRCGREIVGRRGLFITKKRYAILVLDQDGKRQDKDGKPGKVKAMGLDLKRSDTPKVVQAFLSDILLDVLLGHNEEVVIDKIKAFKKVFKSLPAWQQGSPKRVNNLVNYTEKESHGKANLPGHVRAALNWNNLRKMYGDKYSMEIVDGMKVIVCKLKNTPMGYTSVAYPVDQSHLPKWFTELPFDPAGMETSVVDKKIDNLIGILNWDIASQTQTTNTFNNLFSF